MRHLRSFHCDQCGNDTALDEYQDDNGKNIILCFPCYEAMETPPPMDETTWNEMIENINYLKGIN